MAKLDKNNYKRFTRKSLLPNVDGTISAKKDVNDILSQNHLLLDKAKKYYDSLQHFRDTRDRCKKYYFGDQLSDIIKDPDTNLAMTEEQLLVRQGITPMSLNIIRKAAKAVLGVYTTNKLEPVCTSRDRDEQKLGEMMTIAMEYAYQSLKLPEYNTRGCEEFLISGMPGFRVGYDINQERKTSEVCVSLIDNNRIFFDSNTTGLYFENISFIGYLHDYHIGQVLSKFAHSKKEADQIRQIYRDVQDAAVVKSQFTKDKDRTIDFYHPFEPEFCRVIEIWSKEQYDSLYCHDTALGEQYFLPSSEEDSIIAENNKRIFDMLSVGGSEEDAALIEYEYKVEEKWVVRNLTPNGYVLSQEESPYEHGSHPFVIGAFPLVDGEIHSFTADAINPQRMVNRLLARIEYQRMNDIKGTIVINKAIRERSGITLEEISHIITSPAGVLELDWEAGDDPIRQYHSTSAKQDDVLMLGQYMSLLDQITGAHGAMRGETASASKASSLYAQEAQNANNNIADMISWYNGLIQKRDYKIMQIIQQFYTDKRYINIAGKDYAEESKWYNPDKIHNSEFDLSLNENHMDGIFRAQNEQLLGQLIQQGAIDIEMYLESTSLPFADKMLERIKQQRELAAQQQAQQQEQMAQQQQQAQMAAMQGGAMPQQGQPMHPTQQGEQHIPYLPNQFQQQPQ